MQRKAAKILKEADSVIEQQDISRAMEYILDEVALGQTFSWWIVWLPIYYFIPLLTIGFLLDVLRLWLKQK